MKDRLKQIKSEIWEEHLKIEESKKKIKQLHQEADQIMGYKKIERQEQCNKSKGKKR